MKEELAFGSAEINDSQKQIFIETVAKFNPFFKEEIFEYPGDEELPGLGDGYQKSLFFQFTLDTKNVVVSINETFNAKDQEPEEVEHQVLVQEVTRRADGSKVIISKEYAVTKDIDSSVMSPEYNERYYEQDPNTSGRIRLIRSNESDTIRKLFNHTGTDDFDTAVVSLLATIKKNKEFEKSIGVYGFNNERFLEVMSILNHFG